MTVPQATYWACSAAAAGDLDALKQALAARAGAIAALVASPPSVELEGLLQQAIDAGTALGRDIAAMKRRMACESSRMTQLSAGLVAGFGSCSDPHFDFRG
jgi:hypothetical protein